MPKEKKRPYRMELECGCIIVMSKPEYWYAAERCIKGIPRWCYTHRAYRVMVKGWENKEPVSQYEMEPLFELTDPPA